MRTGESNLTTKTAAVSDRATNAFDNAAKTASREGNLLVLVEQADELWEAPGQLRPRAP